MLTIRRPTSNTTLYTISTRTPARTLTGHAYNARHFLIRLIALGVLLLMICMEYERTRDPTDRVVSDQLLVWFEDSVSFNDLLRHFNTTLTLRLAACCSAVWLVFRRTYTEETLLVVRGLGVQTSTSSASYLWTNTTRFIPTTAVQDIFIHEAFIGFKVRHYLTIIVENEPEMVVVFPNTLPKLEHLRTVWRGARACLYEPKT